MDLATLIRNQIAQQRAEEMESSDQLALGELIEKVEPVSNPRALVFLDGGETPRNMDSWRGSYCELAMNFDDVGLGMPICEFIDMLKDSDGATFQGYKGGDFTMSRQTPVWVAHHGDAGERAVVGVEIRHDGHVVIRTKEIPYGEW